MTPIKLPVYTGKENKVPGGPAGLPLATIEILPLASWRVWGDGDHTGKQLLRADWVQWLFKSVTLPCGVDTLRTPILQLAIQQQ